MDQQKEINNSSEQISKNEITNIERANDVLKTTIDTGNQPETFRKPIIEKLYHS